MRRCARDVVAARQVSPVLFEARFREAIADGSVTLTFRRWKRCQAVAGHRYRTAAGMIEVEQVSVVGRRRSRMRTPARRLPVVVELVADLRGPSDLPLYRVRFHAVAGPDPRDELTANARLSTDDVAEIDRRLDRLDRASSAGPWTADVLALIAERPGVRAGDLAAALGRETASFKLDVRKLKNLGLTISLEVGYRLSPRGTRTCGTPHVRRKTVTGRGSGDLRRTARAIRIHYTKITPHRIAIIAAETIATHSSRVAEHEREERHDRRVQERRRQRRLLRLAPDHGDQGSRQDALTDGDRRVLPHRSSPSWPDARFRRGPDGGELGRHPMGPAPARDFSDFPLGVAIHDAPSFLTVAGAWHDGLSGRCPPQPPSRELSGAFVRGSTGQLVNGGLLRGTGPAARYSSGIRHRSGSELTAPAGGFPDCR